MPIKLLNINQVIKIEQDKKMINNWINFITLTSNLSYYQPILRIDFIFLEKPMD